MQANKRPSIIIIRIQLTQRESNYDISRYNGRKNEYVASFRYTPYILALIFPLVCHHIQLSVLKSHKNSTKKKTKKQVESEVEVGEITADRGYRYKCIATCKCASYLHLITFNSLFTIWVLCVLCIPFCSFRFLTLFLFFLSPFFFVFFFFLLLADSISRCKVLRLAGHNGKRVLAKLCVALLLSLNLRLFHWLTCVSISSPPFSISSVCLSHFPLIYNCICICICMGFVYECAFYCFVSCSFSMFYLMIVFTYLDHLFRPRYFN